MSKDGHIDRSSRSHVVILGAGASRACCPNGDANGKQLPVFADLAAHLDLTEGLLEAGLPVDNFEDAYSQAAQNPSYRQLAMDMEAAVQSYFGDLRLPAGPTIYDYLLRSLRPQDIVATFNWDPLLEQALQRFPAKHQEELPCHAYLHGSVALNQCNSCARLFSWTDTCPRCGEASSPQPLLYPVGDKDYASTPGLKEAWHNLHVGLDKAYMVTLFGYSGPATDYQAVRLFTEKWHGSPVATSGDIAFINTCSREAIEKAWATLLAKRDDGRIHWDLYRDYHATRLARFPRRSTEESYQRNVLLQRWRPTPYPRCGTIAELDQHYEYLLAQEHTPDGRVRVPTSISAWPTQGA